MSQRGNRGGQSRGGGRGGHGAPRGGVGGPGPGGRGAGGGSVQVPGGSTASPGFTSPTGHGQGGARGGGSPYGGPGRGRGRGGPTGGAPGIFAAGQPAHIDARLTNKDQDNLVAAFKTAPPTDKRNTFPLRPDWGTKGTPVTLRANHFPIVFSDNILYNYEIDITPKPKATSKRLKRRIIQLAESTPEFQSFKLHVAHDFAERLISAQKIPDDVAEFSIAYFDEEEDHPRENATEYTIKLNFMGEMDPSELRR